MKAPGGSKADDESWVVHIGAWRRAVDWLIPAAFSAKSPATPPPAQSSTSAAPAIGYPPPSTNSSASAIEHAGCPAAIDPPKDPIWTTTETTGVARTVLPTKKISSACAVYTTV
ncbi:hypothetical protein Atai01_29850 [Amycolatopsis taiwanensis]|uniref:Uncharacterized protein n=1 Tax=Amycolatopsis taiwanensis TaxID=342230 RepID=A0A9W6VHC9_9PSEU|nr:hypothetical protein Atai01_29850 [Amycolatopsis taiwanensis]